MQNNKFSLINQEKVNSIEVIEDLLGQKLNTTWSEQTNHLAVDYLNHLTSVYGEVWYKGLLSKEMFEQILLPKHKHNFEREGNDKYEPFWPLDTLIKDTKEYFKINISSNAKDCLLTIEKLKKDIKENGLNKPLILGVINDTLKHVDGLHRMIALFSLLEEGYEYKLIPVFVIDSTYDK